MAVNAETPALSSQVELALFSTLGIGGPARRLVRVGSADDLEVALAEAAADSLPVFYLGEGSNVLFDDSGFDGVIIHNQLTGRQRDGATVRLGGAENLGAVIEYTNSRGLQGLERLYGIPGTIAGAVVGNAGAYGQEIGDRVRQVEVWVDGALRRCDAAELQFSYRHSRFKERREWFLTACTLELTPSQRPLQQVSDAILSKRLEKYPAKLRCPGSFFKNVPVGELSPEALEAIPDSFIMFGKVPAGRLLEAVGANGTRRGDAAFAGYHGNLLMNVGQATSSDLLALATEYAEKVRRRFGVELKPEIDIVPPQGPGLESRERH